MGGQAVRLMGGMLNTQEAYAAALASALFAILTERPKHYRESLDDLWEQVNAFPAVPQTGDRGTERRRNP